MMGCAELHLAEPPAGTADPPDGSPHQLPEGEAATRRALAALMADFFYLVSFAAGTYPRYGQVRALFVPGGLLVRGTEVVPHVQTVEQFAKGRHAEVEAGTLTQFHEWELSEHTQVFGHVAQRFSRYRKSGVYRGRGFVEHGVISTQFVHGPQGWRISAMAWDDERPGGKLSGQPWPPPLRAAAR